MSAVGTIFFFFFLENVAAIKIRGLCEKSLLSDHREEEQSDAGYGQAEFDSEYFAYPDRISGETIFRGRFGSRIRKNVTDFEVEHRPGDWFIESLITPYRDDSSIVLKKVLVYIEIRDVTVFPI